MMGGGGGCRGGAGGWCGVRSGKGGRKRGRVDGGWFMGLGLGDWVCVMVPGCLCDGEGL
jgi:hypothetical protein